MKIPGSLALAAGPVLGSFALRALGSTLRVRREEAAVAPLWAARTPLIYAMWHGRLLLLPYLYGLRGGARAGQPLAGRRDGGALGPALRPRRGAGLVVARAAGRRSARSPAPCGAVARWPWSPTGRAGRARC